jgi:hypothetical protein
MAFKERISQNNPTTHGHQQQAQQDTKKDRAQVCFKP